MRGAIPLALLSLVAAGCTSNALGAHDYVARVTGTAGMPFIGTLTVTYPSGQVSSTDVDGSIQANPPVEYRIHAAWLDACFKQTGDQAGLLSIEIERDGKVVARQSTSADLGNVCVTSPHGA